MCNFMRSTVMSSASHFERREKSSVWVGQPVRPCQRAQISRVARNDSRAQSCTSRCRINIIYLQGICRKRRIYIQHYAVELASKAGVSTLALDSQIGLPQICVVFDPFALLDRGDNYRNSRGSEDMGTVRSILSQYYAMAGGASAAQSRCHAVFERNNGL